MTHIAETTPWRTEHRLVSRDLQRVHALVTDGRSHGVILYGIVNAYTQHNRVGGPRIRIRSHVGHDDVIRAVEIKEPSASTAATRKRRYEFHDLDLGRADRVILTDAEQRVRDSLNRTELVVPIALPEVTTTASWTEGPLRITGIVSYKRMSFWWNDESRVTVDEMLSPAALANGTSIIETKGAPIPELADLVAGTRLEGGKWELLNGVGR